MKNAIFFFILLSSFLLSSQQIKISGIVSDHSGYPLPGATVVEKGTNNGTQTDFDGNYELTVQKGAELTFSYIGYRSQAIIIRDIAVINVSLEEDYEALQEVVVLGYGTRSYKSITGSVSMVSGNQIKRTPTKKEIK